MVMDELCVRGNSQGNLMENALTEGRAHCWTNVQQASLCSSDLFSKEFSTNTFIQSTILGGGFTICVVFVNPFWQISMFW